MNPWKIIGWIVLGFLILVIGSCFLVLLPRTDADRALAEQRDSRAAGEPSPPAAPPYELTVDAYSCQETRIFPVEMKIQVRNTGPRIQFAKLFATIGGKPENVYLQPLDIPAGALAEATIVSQNTGACRIVGIQGRDGQPVRIVMNAPE